MDSRPPLLYLVHRIPYPPNKGDKVRSFNILRQLARSYRVFLGTFVDQDEDWPHVETLRQWCQDICVQPLARRRRRLTSLSGLLTGEALSLPYYRSSVLQRWVEEVVRTHGIRRALAFSGPMAQYLDGAGLERRVVDFCDVDSAKWTAYAERHSWPMSALYRREGARLLAFERKAAAAADAALFVTQAEADLFRRLAPETATQVMAMPNGVDEDYFSPARDYPSPYPPGGPVVVFTGAMDYWPNVDAVGWFVRGVLPIVRAVRADVRFFIVGMNPAPEVSALAGAGVVVTGSVPDVRPWIAHADVVVAPLRVARGIQNKVLEAMAMAKPVVVSAASAIGLDGTPGRDFLVAEGEAEFARQVLGLLDRQEAPASMGVAARQCVQRGYSWGAHLALLDRVFADTSRVTPAEGWSDDDPRALVVHVVYRFDVGGLENGVVNLINRMPSSRFRHAVIALTECVPGFCTRVTQPDVRYFSLHKPPGHGAQLYPALYRLFRELRPSIVHTRNLAALEAAVPAWFAGVPVRVHGEHGWDVSDPRGTRLRFRLVRRVYRPFVTQYIALSGHLESYLISMVGVPKAHVVRICNGVDTARFRVSHVGRASLKGWPFGNEVVQVVGTVGRLETIKDPLNLVRAFALLVSRMGERGRSLRLMIVGDGGLRGAIESASGEAGIGDRVWLAGGRGDVPELMRAMDVFALPSRAEGISNTVLEAMASGLPVVATRVGGNPELVIDGETGALVPPDDAAAMAMALERYVADPALAERHGAAGRLRVEQEFSIDGMVADYAGLYESLLVEAGRTVPVG